MPGGRSIDLFHPTILVWTSLKMKPLFSGYLLFSILALNSSGNSAEDPQSSQAAAGNLVKQLGDINYAARAEAEQELRRLGRKAISAVEIGLLHPDGEIRRRCESILSEIKRSDIEVDLDAFVQNQRDSKLPPLPGWNQFKNLSGEDLAGRLVYVEQYRYDKNSLELLEKKPAELSGQFTSRLQKFQPKANFNGSEKEIEAAKAEFRSLVLSALAGKPDLMHFNQMNTIFYGVIARSATANSIGTRRLVGRLFSDRMKDINQAQQYMYIANYLNLKELIETEIRPIVEKQVDEAIKSKDNNRLVQVVYMANNLRSFGLMETKLKPAVLRLVEEAIPTDDYNKLQQAVSLCQVLQMKEILEERLKPSIARYILKTGDNLKDMGRIYQSRYLAQNVGLNDMLDAIMRPAVIKLVADSAENSSDINSVQNAFYIANNLNMQELNEGLLKPAARNAVIASLEQPGDWNRMSQAINICQQLGLQDVLEQSVKPVFSRNAAALVGETTKDPNRLQQVYYMASNLGATQVIEEQIKPALKKYFQSANLDKNNMNNNYQMMYLAKNMQIKEAVPFALKTASAKDAAGYVRGLAIQFVGEFGSKEQIPLLEPFLTDKGEVGQAGVNFTTVKAEVRDVALAVLLVHKGENLANYGYPYFQIVQGINLYQTSAMCAGFADTNGRDAAFKKYSDLLAKQKKQS